MTKRRRSRKHLQLEQETEAALGQPVLDEDSSHPGATAAKKPRQRKTRAAVATAGDAVPEAATTVLDVLDHAEEQQAAAVVVPKKGGGRKRQAATDVSAVEAVNAAVAAVTGDATAKRKPKRQRIKATEMAVKTETELVEPAQKGTVSCWRQDHSMRMQAYLSLSC